MPTTSLTSLGIPADGPLAWRQSPRSPSSARKRPGCLLPQDHPLIQQLLLRPELTQDPAAYSKLVAVLVYTAERSQVRHHRKQRQDWMDLLN